MLADLREAVASMPAPAKRLALALAAATIALSALGFVHAIFIKIDPFEIGGEVVEGVRFVPVFSALLLLSAAVLCARAAVTEELTVPPLAWATLAAVFAFMTFDELIQIHEWLENETGITWQLFYLPLLIAGGLAWLSVLRAIRERVLELSLWIFGAGAWVLARMIDNIPYSIAEPDRFDIADAAAGIEEVLEMSGNAAWVLTMALITLPFARGE
jgi:hypothetical protein